MFPYSGKTHYLSCNNCGSAINSELLDNSNLPPVDTEFKTPLWTFSGLFIILIIMLFSMFSGSSSSTESEVHYSTSKFREDPRAGYVFVFQSNEHAKTPYSFIKIEDIDEDKAIVSVGKYFYSSSYDARSDAKHSKNYSDGEFQISLEELKNLNIYSIVTTPASLE